MHLLCRNKVRDFAQWKRVFDSHDAAHKAAGLMREWLRRSCDDPNEVFYSFAVLDEAKAKAFLSAPAVPDAQRESGFIDGNFWFIAD
jgi:hypothetical protein